MDNAGYHKSDFIKQFAQGLQFNFILNAPYSPKGNPIENFFNLLK